jgi:ribosomal-protein-alanine N-acetyltransferase
MNREDIAQVNEIDREAFPTQIPPPNYRHELQNQLARYIVVCDDNRILEEPEAKPDKGLSRLVSRMKRWLHPESPPNPERTPPGRQYIVGFAGTWALSDEAHITNIAVRQQYQRRGVGELMLITIIDLAKTLKTNTLTLEVRVSNVPAQNLYRKYGFAQVGIRRGYYLDNKEDGIIMSTENINSTSFQARLQPLREALARKLNVRKNPGE